MEQNDIPDSIAYTRYFLIARKAVPTGKYTWWGKPIYEEIRKRKEISIQQAKVLSELTVATWRGWQLSIEYNQPNISKLLNTLLEDNV
jgi:hypothetical protein